MRILLMSILLITGCATRKDGCGTENYKRPFTVQAIKRTPGSDNGWTVVLSPYRLLRYMKVPDSIVIGKTVML